MRLSWAEAATKVSKSDGSFPVDEPSLQDISLFLEIRAEDDVLSLCRYAHHTSAIEAVSPTTGGNPGCKLNIEPTKTLSCDGVVRDSSIYRIGWSQRKENPSGIYEVVRIVANLGGNSDCLSGLVLVQGYSLLHECIS
jgi:hypothetical protein